MPFLSHGTKTHHCDPPGFRERRRYGVHSGARWYCPECSLIYAWSPRYDGPDWISTGKFHEDVEVVSDEPTKPCEHRFRTNSTPDNGHKTHCISCGVLVHDDNWWRRPHQSGSAQ